MMLPYNLYSVFVLVNDTFYHSLDRTFSYVHVRPLCSIRMYSLHFITNVFRSDRRAMLMALNNHPLMETHPMMPRKREKGQGQG